jgi:hypothetical protein
VKKLFIFAVALLALGFAASAFAIQAEIPADTTAAVAKGKTQITIGGDLRVRGVAANNTSDFNRHVTSDGSFGKNERMLYDYRYRLDIKAQVTPNTVGFLRFQVGEDTASGQNGVMGNPYDYDARGSIQFGDTNTNTVRLNQAWIQHSGSGLLGVPAYIKVGHQPVTVGAGVFYSHTYNNDDAIVLGVSPIKGLDLTLLTVKLAENSELAADDIDLYSLMASYQINKDWKVGIDVSLLQAQHNAGLIGDDYYLFLSPANSWPTTVYWDGKYDLWNIGLNVKGTPVPGLKLYATADFQFGELKSNEWGWQTSKDFRGYAFTFGGSYKFAPVTVALDFGYGSGDDATDANNMNSRKFKTFMTAQSNVQHYAFVYDYYTVNAAGNAAGGLQNTMFAKLSANGDVMKNLNVGGSIILLNAAKKAIGDNLTNWIAETDSRYIGTEVDATLTYQIDKGLKYFVEAGYLFAGNYWKAPVNMNQRQNLDSSVSDPWVVRHGIQLTF